MTESTMADQRRVPVGYRFCPTEEELVAYYLRHKLMAHNPLIDDIIPEINVCEYEPSQLPALVASVFPEMEQDDSECYFFHRCSYRPRFKRKTPDGFWKVTGKDRRVKRRDSENVIGNMKILVHHKRRAPHVIRDNYKWVIHEYHYDDDDDVMFIPEEQRIYVVCKLMKKYRKKTKEKPNDFGHKSISHERESNSEEDYSSEIADYSSEIEELQESNEELFNRLTKDDDSNFFRNI